jgi:Sugar (and other) transporter
MIKIGLAFFYAKDPETQWRGPLGLALVWPLMMLLVICFVPESPRVGALLPCGMKTQF